MKMLPLLDLMYVYRFLLICNMCIYSNIKCQRTVKLYCIMDSSLTNVEDRLSEAVEDIDTIQLVRRDSHAIISKKKFQQKVKDVETSNANRRRDYKNHRYAAVAKVHDHHHPWTFTFGMPHTDLNTSDKIYHILHNRYVHLCLSSLLLVDIIIIIVSISLEIQYLFSKISDYEAVVSDCQSALNDGENAHRCEAAEVGNESLIEIFEYLANVSLAILSLFLLESIILLVAKPYHFFSSLMYPLDLIVVVVSIALDLVFHSASQSGLLVLVRAWYVNAIIYTCFVFFFQRLLTHLYLFQEICSNRARYICRIQAEGGGDCTFRDFAWH